MVALDQPRSSSAADRESRGFPATADRSGQKGRFHPEVRLVGGDGRSSSGRRPGLPRPDFGPNVKIFDPSMSTSQIQSVVDSVYAQQVDSELRDQALRPPLQAGDVRRDRADGFGR
jgi:hypothetical protein